MIPTLSIYSNWILPLINIIGLIIVIIVIIVLIKTRIFVKWIVTFIILSIGSSAVIFLCDITIPFSESIWFTIIALVSFVIALMFNRLDTPEFRHKLECEKKINNMVERRAGVYCQNCEYYGCSSIRQFCSLDYSETYGSKRACPDFQLKSELWDETYDELRRKGAFRE